MEIKPVTITLIEGTKIKIILAKPYPVPLKNREMFKQEFYYQCSIHALHELFTEEIKECKWASPAFGIPKNNSTLRLVIEICDKFTSAQSTSNVHF